MIDNVTDIEAQRLARLLMEQWLDAYSDNGSLWLQSKNRYEAAAEGVSEDVQKQAWALAQVMWKKSVHS